MAHDDHDVCLVPPRPASENAVAKPQRTKSVGTPIAGWFINWVTRMDLGNLYIGGIVMNPWNPCVHLVTHYITIWNPLTHILSNHHVHCMSYLHAPRCSFCRHVSLRSEIGHQLDQNRRCLRNSQI